MEIIPLGVSLFLSEVIYLVLLHPVSIPLPGVRSSIIQMEASLGLSDTDFQIPPQTLSFTPPLTPRPRPHSILRHKSLNF